MVSFVPLQVIVLLYLLINLVLSLIENTIRDSQYRLSSNQIIACSISLFIKTFELLWILCRYWNTKSSNPKDNFTKLSMLTMVYSNVIDLIIIIAILPYRDFVIETILRCIQFTSQISELQTYGNRLFLTGPLIEILIFSFYSIFISREDESLISHVTLFILILGFTLVSDSQLWECLKLPTTKPPNNNTNTVELIQSNPIRQYNFFINYTRNTPQFKYEAEFSRQSSPFVIPKDSSDVQRLSIFAELSRTIDPLPLIEFLERMDTGIIIYNHNLETCYKNHLTRDLESQNEIPSQLLDIKITRIDKHSMKILGYNKLQRSNSAAQNSIAINDRNKTSGSITLARSLQSILEDVLNLPNKDQLQNICIQVLEYETTQSALYITIKTIVCKGNLYCLVQATNLKERDLFLKRVFSFKIMRQLFMSFSHEFGTSLNYILALAQVAEQEDNLSNYVQQTFFKPISGAGQMMQYKVSDMLDYNRILGKEFQLTLSPINLKECLKDLQGMFQRSMEHKGLSLRIIDKAYESTIILMTDQQRVLQVVVNLLSNAQKFTKDGGITIYVEDVEIFDSHYVKVMVEDTGIGMEYDEQDRLNAFLQSGVKDIDRISKHSAGFGLGLLISNRLASELSRIPISENGGIRFDTHVSHGSSFWFHIKNRSSQVQFETSSYQSSQAGIIEMGKKSVFDMRSSQINNHYLERSKIDNMNFVSMRHSNPYAGGLDRLVTNGMFMADLREFNLQTIQTFHTSHMVKFNTGEYSSRRKASDDSMASEIRSNDRRQKQQYLGNNQPKSTIKRYKPERGFSHKLTKFTKSEKNIGFLEAKHQTQNIQINVVQCQCNDIMVVDDEPTNIFALTLLLKKYHLKADNAYNGLECLKLIKERLERNCSCDNVNYKLIFMDINMPVMDGFKATKQIREMQTFQPIICAVTAFVDVKTKQESYDSGMNYFMNKPVKLIELEKVLSFFEMI